ncbi:putative RNA-directed DNA polymerase [Rosa chinensis]|uniref:Putative RNA-directed DNA polymerase n=1 Tax=Rosa chinensis TaxID=74649 RepID=A0A2P6P1Z7_ROSCH|nr:putative RNA-directed DNA polymerase [Rosa chinensis]
MATSQTPFQIYMLLSMMTRRLNDNNFITWSYQLQTLLEGHDLFGYIDGNTLCPTKYVITDDEGVTGEITATYKEWMKTDKAILSLLIATLSSDTRDYVVGSKTSREAWMRLNDRYATVSRSYVMQLKTDLYTITKGMDFVEKYLMKITRARNQLDALGVRMEDQDIVVVLLNGLPAEFNIIKAIIRARKTQLQCKN